MLAMDGSFAEETQEVSWLITDMYDFGYGIRFY
jgi:hypothetical protein